MNWRAKVSGWGAVVLVVLAGCDEDGPAGNYKRPLPRGYKLTSYSAGSIVIEGLGGLRTVIGGRITRIGVFEDLVIGKVEPGEGADVREFVELGYFWLDTKTGKLVSGLTEKELEALLPQGFENPEELMGTPKELPRVLEPRQATTGPR